MLADPCKPQNMHWGTYWRLRIKAEQASTRSLLIGAKKLDLSLSMFLPTAAASCRLWVAPVFIQQHRASAGGTYTYERALPSTAVGLAHAQFLEARPNGKVFATNGVTVTCK